MPSEDSTQVVGTAYITTLQGICKIVEIIASFIGVLLVGINFWGPPISVFESAAAFSIISAAFFLIVYITASIQNIPWSWNRIQFFFHIILAVYYIIASALVLRYNFVSQLAAGGAFGLIATVAHLVDGYDNYRKQPLC